MRRSSDRSKRPAVGLVSDVVSRRGNAASAAQGSPGAVAGVMCLQRSLLPVLMTLRCPRGDEVQGDRKLCW